MKRSLRFIVPTTIVLNIFGYLTYDFLNVLKYLAHPFLPGATLVASISVQLSKLIYPIEFASKVTENLIAKHLILILFYLIVSAFLYPIYSSISKTLKTYSEMKKSGF